MDRVRRVFVRRIQVQRLRMRHASVHTLESPITVYHSQPAPAGEGKIGRKEKDST